MQLSISSIINRHRFSRTEYVKVVVFTNSLNIRHRFSRTEFVKVVVFNKFHYQPTSFFTDEFVKIVFFNRFHYQPLSFSRTEFVNLRRHRTMGDFLKQILHAFHSLNIFVSIYLSASFPFLRFSWIHISDHYYLNTPLIF